MDALPSSTFQRTLAKLRRFAADRHAPILIEGESGTGKTALARIVHEESPRAAAPFQAVLLSEVEDALCASELFGHVAGAFTGATHPRAGLFASANAGTLFLDEIGKASRHVQGRLLNAVEYGEIRPVGSDRTMSVDVRVVVATNRPLAELTRAGEFLPDLEARLDPFRVVLPPLRERRADIPVLAEHCLEFHCTRSGVPIPVLSDELVSALQAATWPNNVRQLSATMHRLLVESRGAAVLTLDGCRDDLAWLADGRPGAPTEETDLQVALERAGGNRSEAARLLGVHRTTLHRRLKRGDGGSSEGEASAVS